MLYLNIIDPNCNLPIGRSCIGFNTRESLEVLVRMIQILSNQVMMDTETSGTIKNRFGSVIGSLEIEM